MLNWLADRMRPGRPAEQAYAAIVAQSRLPAFYEQLGVPDTVTGRFEMIVLHIVLLADRLRGTGEGAKARNLALSEAFVADLDSALRELGVSDIIVSKRMHALAGAFYGRMAAYDAGLADAEAGPANLEAAITRNVLAGSAGKTGAAALARYVRGAKALLATQDVETLRRGVIIFPPLDPVGDGETQP